MILPRRLIRHLVTLGVILGLLLIATWSFIPSDNIALLAVRFNVGRLLSVFRGSGTAKDAWLWQPAAYPVDKNDIGLLIKTGYGTRQRVPALLEAYGLEPSHVPAFIIVADFARPNGTAGEPTIEDAVGGLLQEKAVARLENSPRFSKYKHLAAAIADGEEKRALEIGKSFGWELDALKVRATTAFSRLRILLTLRSLYGASSTCMPNYL
jgi:hypothetical protein